MNIAQKAASLLGLAVLAALGLGVRPAQADTITMFDYPNGSNTRGLSINDSGNVVGVFNPSQNVVKGYERMANGTFSAPIVDPSDNQNFTRAVGINNAGTIVGDYLENGPTYEAYHGYILKNGTFTTFDVGGPVSTDIFAINNNGDFAGIYGSSVQTNEGFLDVGGTLTKFNGPTGNTGTYPNGINSSDVVVGNYVDSSGINHGFRRDPNTGVITTIDVPGSYSTSCYGINDLGVIVGGYQTNPNDYHGFIDKAGVITTFDLPGATSTSISTINNAGVIVGNYTDNFGNFHGYIDAPPPGHTHLLWDKSDGTASLWIVNADNTYASVAYGPYAGWTAKATAAAPDGTNWLLWTNTNGTASLWHVTALTASGYTATQYGPYAGYTAVSLSVGSDGSPHLLWDKTDGTALLWTVSPTNGTFTYTTYGPFSGWTANKVASGPNVTDLLWTNVNGMAAGYRIASDGTYVTHAFGPYSGYAAAGLSVGPDNGAHLLWDKTDGTALLWSADFNSGAFTYTPYGPFSGYSTRAIATGPDDVTHILWNATNGTASLWAVAGSGFTYNTYGPFSGWTAVGVSAGP